VGSLATSSKFIHDDGNHRILCIDEMLKIHTTSQI